MESPLGAQCRLLTRARRIGLQQLPPPRAGQSTKSVIRQMKLSMPLLPTIRFKALLLLALLLTAGRSHALPIDSIFTHVPAEVLPLLERNARLDMLDYYNARMPAVGENTLGGQAFLLGKHPDLLRVEVTPVTVWELKVLTTERDTFFVVTRSLRAGGTASRLAAYDARWRTVRLDLPQPAFDDFFHPCDSLASERCAVLRSLLEQAPVEARWQAEGRSPLPDSDARNGVFSTDSAETDSLYVVDEGRALAAGSLALSDTDAALLASDSAHCEADSLSSETAGEARYALDTLTFTVSLDALSPDDRPDARRCLRSVCYVWCNGRFVRKQCR